MSDEDIKSIIDNLNKNIDNCVNIKELRALTTLTQAQFSKFAKLPKRTLENWERGVNHPPEYSILWLKPYIQVNLENFLKK